MCLYEIPLSMSLLGFGMGTMLANFLMCVLLRQPCNDPILLLKVSLSQLTP